MSRGKNGCEALVQRLNCYVELKPEDRTAVVHACLHAHHHVEARADFIHEGDRMSGVHILTEGWAYRLMLLPDGRRQIAGLLIPGDICTTAVPDVRLDYAVCAVTDCSYIYLGQGALGELRRSRPAVAAALNIHEYVSHAIMRNWVLNLGQRNAFERIGHLFCELWARLTCIGQVEDHGFQFPINQIELAEATGLTAVHVNRTIQDMRARGLISLHNKQFKILDFERLASIVMFDPSYLHPTDVECARQ